MLRCTECDCVSERAPGWVALVVHDPDGVDAPSVVVYCPPCVARELAYESVVAYT